MWFSAKSDIAASAAQVFDRLTAYEDHATLLRRRGVEVTRIDALAEPGPGATWAAAVKFRGKLRHMTVDLQEVDPKSAIITRITGNGLTVRCEVALIPLAANRTRLALLSEVRHQNLTGRLLIQSMRIIKPRLDARLQKRLDAVARYLGRGV